MIHCSRCVLVTLAGLAVLASTAMGDDAFDQLTQGEVHHGFTVNSLYLDGRDVAIGARFLHKNTGFTIDLFHIQSVPQGFFWVNSPSETDMGEPHTCEHLLLGKGNKGRYVASLEDMTLGMSTAYTAQLYTCYSFNSSGGNDVFFDLFRAKLDALVHPDFSDEEIRREVCNLGVTENPATGALQLEEKGTIYTEMVSAFEKNWYYMFLGLGEMMYGPDHPLANITGGAPDAIRRMQPADLRAFHQKHYRLNNMGVIVTVPSDLTPDGVLLRLDSILVAIDGGQPHPDVTPATVTLPLPQPTAPSGELLIVTYPGTNDQEPGQLEFSWLPGVDMTSTELMLARTFLNSLGGSQTSNLYNRFINSRTRVLDVGATRVWAGIDEEAGHSVSVGLSNVEPNFITPTDMNRIAQLIIDEIAAVAAYAPGSPELKEFNGRAASYLREQGKELKNYLNTPPGFGMRNGSGGRWYDLMKRLERSGQFRKSLLLKEEMADIMARLDRPENPWAALIDKLTLLTVPPYRVGAKADPQMLTKAVTEKEERLAAYAARLKESYGVSDEAAAIARYKEEYDKNTDIIDREAAKVPVPRFLDNPPMVYDPQLDYRVDTLAGTVPLVASTFNSMTSATVTLAMDLHVIPSDKLLYIPILPEVITEIGVIKDGQVVDYGAMNKRLKDEILSLRSTLIANDHTGRVELTVSGSGGGREESKRALDWMTAALFHPYLEVDNLPRLRDVVDSKIQALRNRMKGSEEGWTYYPANSYRYQTNHLVLAGDCFLTQQHFIHRLKWRLMDAGDDRTARQAQDLFDLLAAGAAGQTKEKLAAFAAAFGQSDLVGMEAGSFAEFVKAYLLASTETQKILSEALADLAAIIPDIPEENAVADWGYLAGQMKADLLYRPAAVLEDLRQMLTLLHHRKATRMYMVSNQEDQKALMPSISALVSSLRGDGEPVRYQHIGRSVITERMASRYPGVDKPTYVGLVNTNTRNGVFVFSDRCARLTDTEREPLLDFLAGKLFSGSGPHSLFMQTWNAGLAYSNGVRSSEALGLIYYYAERCPDLSLTMQFVVDELKDAPPAPELAEYAVAQVFAVNRGSGVYESRAAAMANDLADGVLPQQVTQFRQNILKLRKTTDLYDQLRRRMEKAYGSILIGYGEPLAARPGGNYFIIGPLSQFEKVEQYIAAVERSQTVYRLYPRDYWIID
jgi:Zn-dependent M16 (insulinase) family peptidase